MRVLDDHEAAALAARERERILATAKMATSFAVSLDDEPGTILLVPPGVLRQWRQIGRDLAAVLDVDALGSEYFRVVNRNKPAESAVPVTVYEHRNDGEAFSAAQTLARLGGA